jgi:hypothetical protein
MRTGSIRCGTIVCLYRIGQRAESRSILENSVLKVGWVCANCPILHSRPPGRRVAFPCAFRKGVPRRAAMKHLIIPLLLSGSLIALSTMEASAVVCARGVYRAGCVGAAGVAVVARPIVRPVARAAAVAPGRVAGRWSLVAVGCIDNPAMQQLGRSLVNLRSDLHVRWERPPLARRPSVLQSDYVTRCLHGWSESDLPAGICIVGHDHPSKIIRTALGSRAVTLL